MTGRVKNTVAYSCRLTITTKKFHNIGLRQTVFTTLHLIQMGPINLPFTLPWVGKAC
jgi:hypothetical protein